MSVLEIWGAEYQENDCILIKPEDRSVLEAVCKRERCLMQARRSATARVCMQAGLLALGYADRQLVRLMQCVICASYASAIQV